MSRTLGSHRVEKIEDIDDIRQRRHDVSLTLNVDPIEAGKKFENVDLGSLEEQRSTRRSRRDYDPSAAQRLGTSDPAWDSSAPPVVVVDTAESDAVVVVSGVESDDEAPGPEQAARPMPSRIKKRPMVATVWLPRTSRARTSDSCRLSPPCYPRIPRPSGHRTLPPLIT